MARSSRWSQWSLSTRCLSAAELWEAGESVGGVLWGGTQGSDDNERGDLVAVAIALSFLWLPVAPTGCFRALCCLSAVYRYIYVCVYVLVGRALTPFPSTSNKGAPPHLPPSHIHALTHLRVVLCRCVRVHASLASCQNSALKG